MYMRDNAAMTLLDALGNTRTPRRELQENQIPGPARMNVIRRRTRPQFIHRQDPELVSWKESLKIRQCGRQGGARYYDRAPQKLPYVMELIYDRAAIGIRRRHRNSDRGDAAQDTRPERTKMVWQRL